MAGRVYETAIRIGAAISKAFATDTRSASEAVKKLAAEAKKLEQVQKAAASFSKLTAAIAETKDKLGKGGTTEEMKKAAAELKRLEAALRRTSDSLRRAGVDTSDLSREQDRLAASLARTQQRAGAMQAISGAKRRIFGAKEDQPLLPKLQGQLGGVARDAALLGGGAAAAAAVPLLRFREFDAAIRESATQADEGTSIADLAARARALSVAFGQDHVDQAKALGATISAGFGKLTDASQILTVANKLAIAGTTDLNTSVDGLTTTINAFGMGAGGAARAADVMVATMRLAKTTVPELAGFIYEAAPTAAALGVSFEDLGAATVALTLQGTPTRVAMTRIRAAMDGLVKPSKEMLAIWKGHGYATGTAAIKALGLGGALAIVSKEAGGDAGQIQKLLGSVEAAQTAMVLGGTGAKSYTDALTQLGDAGGSTDKAMKIVTDGFDHQAKLVRAKADDIAIAIGSRLAPIAIEALTRISAWVDQNKERIEMWAASVASWIETRAIPAIQKIVPEVLSFAASVGSLVARIAGWVGGFENLAFIIAALRLAPIVLTVVQLGGAILELAKGVAVLTGATWAGAAAWAAWAAPILALVAAGVAVNELFTNDAEAIKNDDAKAFAADEKRRSEERRLRERFGMSPRTAGAGGNTSISVPVDVKIDASQPGNAALRADMQKAMEEAARQVMEKHAAEQRRLAYQ